MDIDKKHGRTYIDRLLKVYSSLYQERFGVKYKIDNFGRVSGLLKKLHDEYTEYNIALFFIIHFNWYGLDGKNENIYTNLETNGFPIYWVPKKVGEYETYIKGALGFKLTDHDKVKAWVDNHMKQLSR